MTNDMMLGGLYLLMAMMLVLGALINRREPAAKLFVMALAWVAIFGAGFVLFHGTSPLAMGKKELLSSPYIVIAAPSCLRLLTH